MGKSSSNRPMSPGSAITTTTTQSVKIGPDGRRYTTRIEKSRPKYTYNLETKTNMQSAIPEEIDLDTKHFKTWPGIVKILQLVVAILCMLFFSPPVIWFARVLCAVVAVCFAVTIFICFFYLFTLRRVVLPSWPWLKIESLYTNLAALFYLIASVLQLLFSNKENYKISLVFHEYYHDYMVAGVLGLINSVLYAVAGQLLHNKLKRQRERYPKVHIIRTTLDKRGKPKKQKVKELTQITIHPTR